MIPFPDPVVIDLLNRIPSLSTVSVSVVLSASLPALRVTKTGDAEEPSDWEATPLYQIEVWDADELVAGQIAWDIANAWPTARREVVGDALVHGRWVEINPRPSADPETGHARYLLTVGLRLSGATT